MGFEIYSLTEFENKIIKHHFKHKTITSFFRQLNVSPTVQANPQLYDFQRTSDGRKTRNKPNSGQCTFRHKFFTPCSPHNLCHVRRQNKKGKHVGMANPPLTFAPPENPGLAPPRQPEYTPQKCYTDPTPDYSLKQDFRYAQFPPEMPQRFWQTPAPFPFKGVPDPSSVCLPQKSLQTAYPPPKSWAQAPNFMPQRSGWPSTPVCLSQPQWQSPFLSQENLFANSPACLPTTACYDMTLYSVPFSNMSWQQLSLDQSPPFFAPSQLSSPTNPYPPFDRNITG